MFLNFEIVNFPFLIEDVPRSRLYGVCISHFIKFARLCSGLVISTTEIDVRLQSY